MFTFACSGSVAARCAKVTVIGLCKRTAATQPLSYLTSYLLYAHSWTTVPNPFSARFGEFAMCTRVPGAQA